MAKVSEAPDAMRGGQVAGDAVVADAGASVSAGWRVWNFVKGPYPTLLSRLALGGIFLLYGLSKLRTPLQFANDIDAYKMGIPPAIVDTMARVLPIVEIGLGIWLLVGLFTRFAAVITTLLMAIFTTAITQAWVRGIDANCGCFSGTGGSSTDFITGLTSGVMKALGPVGDFLSYEKIGLIPILRDLVFLLMGFLMLPLSISPC